MCLYDMSEYHYTLHYDHAPLSTLQIVLLQKVIEGMGGSSCALSYMEGA